MSPSSAIWPPGMFDGRNLRVFAKTAVVAAVIWILHSVMPSSPVTFAALLLLYVGLVIVTGAVRVAEVTRFVKMAMHRPAAQAG